MSHAVVTIVEGIPKILPKIIHYQAAPSQVDIMSKLLYSHTGALGAFAFLAAGAGAALAKGYIEKEILKRELARLQVQLNGRAACLEEEDRAKLKLELGELERFGSELLSECDCCMLELKQAADSLKLIIKQYQLTKQKIEFLKLEELEHGVLVKASEAEVDALFLAAENLPELNQKKEIQQLKKIRTEKSTDKAKECVKLDRIRQKLQELISINQVQKETAGIGFAEAAALAVSRKSGKIRKLKADFRKFYGRIGELDPDTQALLSELAAEAEGTESHERLQMIRDEAQLKYGKLKEDLAWDKVCREELEWLVEQLIEVPQAGAVLEKVRKLLASRIVTRQETAGISKLVSEFLAEQAMREAKEQERVADSVRQALEALGYEVLKDFPGDDLAARLSRGEAVYLDSKWSGYKVLLKMSRNGELITRLVRVVGTPDEQKRISADQRQKDREISLEWCRDYDRFKAKLSELGFKLETKLRLEPEENEIQYIVDEKIASRDKRAVSQNEKKEI
ncbi:MAG: hypothetical protein PHW04_07840 [Candidatus Wallbacteria bacterium]|nr:hypothetical protein [Candidatus Wallbacteria bacterium]